MFYSTWRNWKVHMEPWLKHEVWCKREGSSRTSEQRELGGDQEKVAGTAQQPRARLFCWREAHSRSSYQRFWCSPYNQGNILKVTASNEQGRIFFFFLLFSFTCYSQLLNYRQWWGQPTLKGAAAEPPIQLDWTAVTSLPSCPWTDNK